MRTTTLSKMDVLTSSEWAFKKSKKSFPLRVCSSYWHMVLKLKMATIFLTSICGIDYPLRRKPETLVSLQRPLFLIRDFHLEKSPTNADSCALTSPILKSLCLFIVFLPWRGQLACHWLYLHPYIYPETSRKTESTTPDPPRNKAALCVLLDRNTCNSNSCSDG